MLTNFITKHKLAALLLIVVLGFSLRVGSIGSVGFNEDEVQKVLAARSYLHGEFLKNLEHPMLMKSLIAISMVGTDLWNRAHPDSSQIREEVPVRLPNIVFGALTSVVIFLLASELFDTGIALLSALLWATGILAITINRVAKEDTLLVFFTWLGYYLYLHAKNLTATDPKRATRFYGASGVSFGLMLASKYFPHYSGLNALYYLLCDRGRPDRLLGKRNTLLFVGAFATVFILADPVILLQSTLKYISHYVSGSSITHHGYLVMGHLYREDASGMPRYFYLLLFVLKTPIPILACLLVGLAEAWKRRREPGYSFALFMFFSWIVPFSLAGPKWLRYMLAWMPAVYIISAIGIVRIWAWLSVLARQRLTPRLAAASAAAFVLVFIVYPAGAAAASCPYYSLYLNPLGFGHTGYYFPHDEMNDMGMRAASEHIAQEAPYGVSVGSEGGPVFRYYFHKYGRDDLNYFNLSDRANAPGAVDSAFVVLQDGRTYFENAALVQSIQSRQRPIRTVQIEGADAARIYRKEEVAGLTRLRERLP